MYVTTICEITDRHHAGYNRRNPVWLARQCRNENDEGHALGLAQGVALGIALQEDGGELGL